MGGDLGAVGLRRLREQPDLVFNTGQRRPNNWVVVTEDTVDYSSRRGNSIGGLDSGQTYVVIGLEDDPTTAVDESHYIQLARTEQQAIDGERDRPAHARRAAGHRPLAGRVGGDLVTASRRITGDAALRPRARPTTTSRPTTATSAPANIDDDKITLTQTATEFNPFELGQAVNYYEPGHDANDVVVEGVDGCSGASPTRVIDGTRTPLRPGGVIADSTTPDAGLDHGGLYYVMTGIDQFNLIGDQRLVDKQVIQLGALENETRGGVARVKIGAAVDPSADGLRPPRDADPRLDLPDLRHRLGARRDRHRVGHRRLLEGGRRRPEEGRRRRLRVRQQRLRQASSTVAGMLRREDRAPAARAQTDRPRSRSPARSRSRTPTTT